MTISLIKEPKPITVVLSDDTPIAVLPIYRKGGYIVIPEIAACTTTRRWQVAVNIAPTYKRVAVLTNKRYACRLANFLARTVSWNDIKNNNRAALVQLKTAIIDWLYARKQYRAIVAGKSI